MFETNLEMFGYDFKINLTTLQLFKCHDSEELVDRIAQLEALTSLLNYEVQVADGLLPLMGELKIHIRDITGLPGKKNHTLLLKVREGMLVNAFYEDKFPEVYKGIAAIDRLLEVL